MGTGTAQIPHRELFSNHLLRALIEQFVEGLMDSFGAYIEN